MKRLIFLAATLLCVDVAWADQTTNPKKVVASNDKSHLGTSFRFDGTSLHGKFQNSPSTTATVENDKFLDDLLGARKHFDDRLKKDSERN